MARKPVFLPFVLGLFFLSAAASARLVGENSIGAAWNAAGLINETVLSWRISFADTNQFLLSESHLDLGGVLSVTPIGGLAGGRIEFSPLLFLDLGIIGGIHYTWKHITFADGTTEYSKSVVDSLSSGTAVFPFISPYWRLKLKFGPLILYNSFYLEKFFTDRLWYWWYPELMIRDGWSFYWSSYTVLQLSKKVMAMAVMHLQKSYDTGDTRITLGPGIGYRFNRDTSLAVIAEYHLKEVNYSGIQLSAGFEFSFSGK